MTYPISAYYPKSEVDELVAAAYNKGVSDGYGLAVKEEVLELHAIKYQEEVQQCETPVSMPASTFMK